MAQGQKGVRPTKKEAKTVYYNNSVDKLKSEGGGMIPYKILKDLAIPDRPSPWSINTLNSYLMDEELANDLATYGQVRASGLCQHSRNLIQPLISHLRLLVRSRSEYRMTRSPRLRCKGCPTKPCKTNTATWRPYLPLESLTSAS